jgi:hypothetical protein
MASLQGPEAEAMAKDKPTANYARGVEAASTKNTGSGSGCQHSLQVRLTGLQARLTGWGE